jgi:O-antigen/teichoic acid export membrane protein
VALLLFVPHFAALALLPRIAKLHADGGGALKEQYHLALRLAVLAGMPAVGGLWLIAGDLVPALFGEGFGPSVLLLRVLAPLVLVEALRSLQANYLTGCDLQGWRTRAEWLTLAVAVPAQLAGIAAAGAVGAALALLASETFLLALFALRLRPLFGWPRIGSRLLIAASGTAAFLLPFGFLLDLPMIVTVPGSAVLYGAVLALFGTIRRHELSLLARHTG